MASIGSIIGGGFRLLTERPVAVAIWALVNLVIGFVSQWLVTGLPADPGGTPEAAYTQVMGMMLPFWLIGVLVYVVLQCAAYRAVLRPEEGGPGFLKLGMDEMRVLLAMVLLTIGWIVGYVLVLLVAMLIAAGMGLVLGAAVTTFIIPVYLAIIAVAIYFWVKLSLIAPVTFARRRLAFDEGWRLTKGRFWTLFLAYLVIALITLVIYAIAFYPVMAPMIAAVSQAAGNPEAMQAYQAEQLAEQMSRSLPAMLGIAALSAVAQAVTLALGAGATATAARELMIEAGTSTEEEVERTAEIFE